MKPTATRALLLLLATAASGQDVGAWAPGLYVVRVTAVGATAATRVVRQEPQATVWGRSSPSFNAENRS